MSQAAHAISRKSLFLSLIMVALSTAPAWAADSGSSWKPGFGLRLFGLDLNFTSDIPALLPMGKTELFASFGGGLLSRGFYRDALGARVNQDSAAGPLQCLDADMWLSGTQFLDKVSHLRASVFLRGKSLTNVRDTADAATLLTLSGLPEAAGAAELGAGAAFGYTNFDKQTASGQVLGVKADFCYEYSYEFYPAAMSTGIVNELSAEFTAFLPLINTRTVSLVAGEHFLASALAGSDIPEFRRSTMGGNRYLSYKAVGGIVRGIPDNSGDGLLKAADNIELRLAFPSVLKGALIPGLIAFFDAGIADNGAYGPDLDSYRISTGALVTVKAIGFTLYAGGLVDLRTFEPGFKWGFGLQF